MRVQDVIGPYGAVMGWYWTLCGSYGMLLDLMGQLWDVMGPYGAVMGCYEIIWGSYGMLWDLMGQDL